MYCENCDQKLNAPGLTSAGAYAPGAAMAYKGFMDVINIGNAHDGDLYRSMRAAISYRLHHGLSKTLLFRDRLLLAGAVLLGRI
jgi:hypothetical protein